MVAGDVVNAISGVGAALSFQPAAGVMCCITSWATYNATMQYRDAANLAFGVITTTAGQAGLMNTKLMIDNTRYIELNASAGQRSFLCGIQIK